MIIISDGFISGCMKIYCTLQECLSHSPWLVGYTFLTREVSFSYNPQCPPMLYKYWIPSFDKDEQYVMLF